MNFFFPHSANNFAMKAKRKTLNAGDVLAAMEEMEFERFLEPLKEALEGQYISGHDCLREMWDFWSLLLLFPISKLL